MGLLLLLLAACQMGMAQEITINTDRPDQSDGVTTVPIGKFQVEEGITFAKKSVINNLMMRYGISNSTEVRLLVDAGKEYDNNGLQPLTLSLKQKIIEQDKIIPAITFVGYVSHGQLATRDFKNKDWNYQLKLAFNNDISDKFSLAYNLGTSNKFESLDLSAGLGYSVSDRTSTYIEYFSTINGVEAQHNTGLGAMYLITPLFQVDIACGHSIFAPDNRFFVVCGASYLFN